MLHFFAALLEEITISEFVIYHKNLAVMKFFFRKIEIHRVCFEFLVIDSLFMFIFEIKSIAFLTTYRGISGGAAGVRDWKFREYALH